MPSWQNKKELNKNKKVLLSQQDLFIYSRGHPFICAYERASFLNLV